MNPLTLEVIAAVAVGAFVIALVLQPLLAGPRAMAEAPSTSPLDDLVDPEETPQGAAVAALREIEFDRATGKLADEDYDYLKQKYTGLALQALRTADSEAAGSPGDATPAPAAAGADAARLDRAALERLVAARAGALGATVVRVCITCGPCPEADADFCSRCGDAVGTGRCAACGTGHRAGGRFCEACGARLAAAS